MIVTGEGILQARDMARALELRMIFFQGHSYFGHSDRCKCGLVFGCVDQSTADLDTSKV